MIGLNKKTGLFWGTVFLLGSNIVTKGLGFFYRVVLVRNLGTEGVGLIEMVTPIFAFLLVISGLGIQTAFSQKIAAKRGDFDKVYFNTAVIMLLITSSLVSIVSLLFAPWLIEKFMPDQRIAMCFINLLPAIVIIGVASSFRGLFQGIKQVSTLGFSQNIEQIVRVVIGIWLVNQLAAATLPIQVSATSIATVGGELAGLILLIWAFRHAKKELFSTQSSSRKFSFKVAKELLSLGLPLTASRLVTSAIMMTQAILIPFCLKMGGWDVRSATEIYGQFSGVAMSLLHFPGVFTAALVVSVLPAVAESMTYDISGRRLMQKRVNDSMQASSSFTLLGMLLLFIFADPLCTMLFHNQPAAPLVRMLTIGGYFLYLEITLSSVLQGLGEVKSLMINYIICGVILIVGIVALTPLPSLGIKGAVLAVNISWICGFFLNLWSFYRKGKVKLDWNKIALKPFIAASVAIAAYYSQKFLFPAMFAQENMTILLGGSIMVIAIYILVLYLIGGLIKIRGRN